MRFTDHINVYELSLIEQGNFKNEGKNHLIKDLQNLVPNKINKKWKANTIFEDRFSIKNLTIFIQMWETIRYKLANDEKIYTSDLYMEVNNQNETLYIIDTEYNYYKLNISNTPSKDKTYIPLENVPVEVDKEYKDF